MAEDKLVSRQFYFTDSNFILVANVLDIERSLTEKYFDSRARKQ